MSPELFHRTRHHLDTEDLSLLFVEDELGRFDFRNNWKKLKETRDVRLQIAQWLEALNVEANPDSIIEFLDRLSEERAGNWR